ncbi:MAG: GlsB/YeaQ/YmgE family stress response membrane protein [Atopostipes suicloacalis]|nr:GlsB/YeaQ/YmgE family stress response membrane protein [Atopostipes suicloacalis]
MGLLWQLLIGAIIGAVAGALTSRDVPMGWIGNIIAGLVGSWLGEMLLGSWGPNVAGMALVPSILGAVILVVIVSMVFSGMNR